MKPYKFFIPIFLTILFFTGCASVRLPYKLADGYIYIQNSVNFVTDEDVYSGIIKAAVFGFIIALMGCYNGFNSKGGAQGVGAATTNAVVTASILILAANYVLTSVIFTR